MLTNPFYCGLISVNGELIQGKHEALISRDVFERVQMKLVGRRKRTIAGTN
jgi:hypothetical protein